MVTPLEQRDDELRALGFKGNYVLRLVIGSVRITAGVSLRGLSLTFTQVGPRSMTQYDVCIPIEATKEMIGNLIRLNLVQNHSSSVEEWDALQYNLEKSKRSK
jgi:hypothetical protein